MKNFGSALVVMIAVLLCGTASAQPRVDLPENLPVFSDAFILAQDSDVSISPAEAADIAQSSVPDSKVLKVKLLPSGVYAVTLKADGSVTRVMVSASDGSVQ